MSARLACVLLAAASAAGCVSQERNDVVAAREAYARCVEVRSADDPECLGLHERLLAAQQRYEGNARRA